jgi:hypothetical protein
MNRITNQMLEEEVLRLNKLLNTEEKNFHDVGFYHLSHAYGGVELQRVANARGGVHCVSRGGHIGKRQLHDWICAYICGIEQAQIAAGTYT